MTPQAQGIDLPAGELGALEHEHPRAPGAVCEIAPPHGLRALSTLPRVDYADTFLVATGPTHERTAEQWARAITEDAPLMMRRTLRRGWSTLGFKLGPTGSDRFVLGWRVRRSAPDVVLLGASSRIGMPAELLLVRRPDQLLFATLVQLGNPLARAVWVVVEPGHKPVVRFVLEQAARRWRAGRRAQSRSQEL